MENALLHLKQWRGIATRHAKNTGSFVAAAQMPMGLNLMTTAPKVLLIFQLFFSPISARHKHKVNQISDICYLHEPTSGTASAVPFFIGDLYGSFD